MMFDMMQTRGCATVDLRILAYAQHMAQTAQPTAARRLFELFAHQEKRRIESGFQLSASEEAQTPPASVSEGDSVRLMRSRSRIERPKAMRRKSDTPKEKTIKKPTGSKGKRVGFQLTTEPGSEVFVAGSFNDWNPTQYPMRDNPGSGHCETAFTLPPGRHEYKFVVNGEWRVDPNCAESVPNDQGSSNSILVV